MMGPLQEDTDDTYSEENTAAKLESEARGASATEPTAQQSAYNDQHGKLFAGLHFWASREVPDCRRHRRCRPPLPMLQRWPELAGISS